MELCFFCEKIKEIREKQGKDYLADLCEDCKKKLLEEILN